MKYLYVVMLMVAVALGASASTWKTHNIYVPSQIQNVVDAGGQVYFLNSGYLFRFDKATCQTAALTSENLLSDNDISQIFYDVDNQLLFVAYQNCNLDVIDASGRVTNVGAVKNTLSRLYGYTINEKNNLESYKDKVINDITFAGGVAYVALNIGYVAIDETTFNVIRHKFFDTVTHINSVTVLGGETMLILSDTYCFYGPVGEEDPLNKYKKYRNTPFTLGKLFPVDDHSAIVLAAAALYYLDFSGGTAEATLLVGATPVGVQRAPGGFIANFKKQNYYYTIVPAGNVATKVPLADYSLASCNPAGDGTVWITDANGLHAQNSDEYYKLNGLTTDIPYWLKYNAAVDQLYVGVSAKNGGSNYNQTPDNVINVYDGSQWSDVTYKAPGGGYEFVINPMDSTTYVRASWNTGLHKVKNNEVVFTYTKTNSLVGTYKAHPAFDIYGNMWVVSSYKNPECPVAVLPKDRVAQSTVAKRHWIQPSGLLALNTENMQRSRFVISKLNNVKIYTDANFVGTEFTGSIMCWDNFNEDPAVDNYKFSSIKHFTDQNQNQIGWTNIVHMEEDADGLIWVGHHSGVFAFDPRVVFNERPTAIRPRVREASMEEDKGYLCEGFTVYDIGIDRLNNKWIATSNGLYYVSSDGTTVYEHYTTRNSDLPSNTVYSVECDPVHDRVYICTDNAFAEYAPASDAAAIDYSDVTVFPNPVLADFTGMVKIGNLMADSYVTVTDREGNIVATMGPVTGSAWWDGAGASGERVPTGIYNIFAAQGAQPAITGKPHATVLIIK